MGSHDGFDWFPLEVIGNMMDGSSGAFVYRCGDRFWVIGLDDEGLVVGVLVRGVLVASLVEK
jgi:hypothetical protein